MKASWLFLALLAATSPAFAAERSGEVLAGAQLGMAKLYGAGQVAGLEGYQSGFFIEASPAVVVTVDSAVLDGSIVTVVDAYGERCEGRVVGRDAASGLALVECPDGVEAPAAFEFADNVDARLSVRVWALSNCFGIAAGDEPVTVQRGRIAATVSMPTASTTDEVRPTLGAPEPGTMVFLLDAVTSNPGAGGGVVIDEAGRLIGVLGAECRSPTTGAWLNYALPSAAAQEAVRRVRDQAGGGSTDRAALQRRPRDVLNEIGLGLIPTITARTPAYVERIDADSPAGEAGCEPDDLVVAVDGATVGTVEAAGVAIARGLARDGEVELTLLRNDRLVTLTLRGDAP